MNYTFEGSLIIHPDNICDTEAKEKLRKCDYFVEADREASRCLYSRYAANANPNFVPPFYRLTRKVQWKDENSFHYLSVACINDKGVVNERNMCVNFSFCTIGSLYVCFYYPSGRYVDFTALEHWIDTFYGKQCSSGGRARGDANNFHNLLIEIDKVNKEN